MKTYYQPIEYFDDGVNIGWGDIPDELASFIAFASKEDAEYWLKEHGYEPGDFNIAEYHDDDIEDVVIIDGDGDVVGNTAERIYGRLCDFIYRYESDYPYGASDLLTEAKDILDQIKYHWDELRSDKQGE